MDFCRKSSRIGILETLWIMDINCVIWWGLRIMPFLILGPKRNFDHRSYPSVKWIKWIESHKKRNSTEPLATKE